MAAAAAAALLLTHRGGGYAEGCGRVSVRVIVLLLLLAVLGAEWSEQ